MIYWLTLFSIFILSLASNKRLSGFIIFYWLLIVSGFIAPGISQDYNNYLNGYYLSDPSLLPEPFSKLIFKIPANLNLPISLSFFVFALVSMFLKKKAVQALGISFSVFCLMYFSKLFLLHDLTQVRAGVAVACCLMALYYYERENNKKTIFYIVIGFLFHYSAIMFTAVFLLGRDKPNVLRWLLFVCISLLFTVINLKNVLFTVFHFFHAPKNYLVYLDASSVMQVNPFSLLSLINLFVFFAISFSNGIFSDRISCIAYKLYGLSLISFYMFINFPVLSFRISEFFLVFQVILLSKFYYIVKDSQRHIYIVLIALFSALQLYMTYNVSNIILPYKFIWG